MCGVQSNFSLQSRRLFMRLIVQKYGGTSVGNAERIRRVAARLLATKRAGHDVVAVISAMAGVTDGLIKLAREMAEQPSEREMDVLLATGEQIFSMRGRRDSSSWPTMSSHDWP